MEYRYDRVAFTLHWLLAFAIFAQLGFGWTLGTLAKGTATRGMAINLHKSTGCVLGLLIVARLLWRLWHAPPRYPDSVSPRSQRLIRIGHGILYACMVIMPLSGYVASNLSRHGIRFFGVAEWPAWGPDLPAAYALLNGAHVVTAYLFAILIAGHVLFALKHLLLDHDRVFARMGLARSL